MPKYHDQEILKDHFKHCIEMIGKPNGKSLDELIEIHEELRQEAQHDVNKITSYTAPEDAKARRQSLYWHEDMLDMLKNYNDSAEFQAEILRGK
jgi:Iap family predicted aminopeptidase